LVTQGPPVLAGSTPPSMETPACIVLIRMR
jgi:hypothetical protein